MKAGDTSNRALVGLALAMIVASLVPIAAIAVRPEQPFNVAAVFPPWWSREQVVAAAESVGPVVRIGMGGMTVAIYGPSDLGARLRQAGAWFILDPQILDCGAQPQFRQGKQA